MEELFAHYCSVNKRILCTVHSVYIKSCVSALSHQHSEIQYLTTFPRCYIYSILILTHSFTCKKERQVSPLFKNQYKKCRQITFLFYIYFFFCLELKKLTENWRNINNQQMPMFFFVAESKPVVAVHSHDLMHSSYRMLGYL